MAALDNSDPNSDLTAISPGKFLVMVAAIAAGGAIFVQNLQPVVVVAFLGQQTIPIPLGVAMLASFLSGGMVAFVANVVSFWLGDRAAFTPRDPEPYAPSAPEFRRTRVQTEDTYAYPGDRAREDAACDEEDEEERVIDVRYVRRPEDDFDF